MVALSAYPALVLNADYQPLSYYPLSLWGWQDTIKAIFLDRVDVVSHYDQVIRSPGCRVPAAQRRGAQAVHPARTAGRRSRGSTSSCATASPASTAAGRIRRRS